MAGVILALRKNISLESISRPLLTLDDKAKGHERSPEPYVAELAVANS